MFGFQWREFLGALFVKLGSRQLSQPWKRVGLPAWRAGRPPELC